MRTDTAQVRFEHWGHTTTRMALKMLESVAKFYVQATGVSIEGFDGRGSRRQGERIATSSTVT